MQHTSVSRAPQLDDKHVDENDPVIVLGRE